MGDGIVVCGSKKEFLGVAIGCSCGKNVTWYGQEWIDYSVFRAFMNLLGVGGRRSKYHKTRYDHTIHWEQFPEKPMCLFQQHITRLTLPLPVVLHRIVAEYLGMQDLISWRPTCMLPWFSQQLTKDTVREHLNKLDVPYLIRRNQQNWRVWCWLGMALEVCLSESAPKWNLYGIRDTTRHLNIHWHDDSDKNAIVFAILSAFPSEREKRRRKPI